MFFAQLLWFWVFATPPIASSREVLPNHDDSTLMSRLVQLESFAADWQKEKQTLENSRNQWEKEKHHLQRERIQWEREKQTLLRERSRWQEEQKALEEKVHSLQEDVHDLQAEKQVTKTRDVTKICQQTTRTTIQPLEAENKHLKEALVFLQRQLASMEKHHQSQLSSLQERLDDVQRDMQSPQDVLTKDDQKPGTGNAEGEVAELLSGTMSVRDHPGNFTADSPKQQDFFPKRRAVRSDDSGPLEAVVNTLAQRTSQLEADVTALKTSDSQQTQAIHAAAVSTFVNWGSSSCPTSTSQLVYSGVMGGSSYDNTGAAANFLCLTMTPRLRANSFSHYTKLYGAEYETRDSYNDMDAVCAVCKTNHPTTIMISGTDACSSGWEMQYSGFLMAGGYGDTGATEFICVNSNLESLPGSTPDNNAHSLFYTATVCGSLPCGPYQENHLVTCVVCSQ